MHNLLNLQILVPLRCCKLLLHSPNDSGPEVLFQDLRRDEIRG